MIKRSILIGLLSLQTICSYAVQLSSITQYGITWNFDHSYECGQFVTGDWWVVGPVTIVSTTPLSASGRNGSMLNPVGPTVGYDNRTPYNYDANASVVFPLTIGGVNSLVSTLSVIDPTDCISPSANSPGWIARNGRCDHKAMTKTMAVLTIVNSVVPAGTFRPSYIGPNYKEFFSVNDIDYNVLPHLPILPSTPNTTNIKVHIDRPWLDHFNAWTTTNNYAFDNSSGYSREMSNDISEIAGCLMLNIPNLDELARLMVQRGIEIYGGLKNGAVFTADGGHGNGRKWPVLFAGKLLNNQGMLNIGHSYSSYVFGEDCQTYYLPGTPSPATAWWGIRHCSDPSMDGTALTTYRYCCTSTTWVGQMLTAMMLGLKDDWNHDAYFDYVDRWITESGGCTSGTQLSNFGSNTPQFIKDLWCLYRNNLPSEITHSGGNSNPDNIAPTVPINLVASAVAGNSLTLTWTQSTDNIGVIAYDIYQNNVFNKTVGGSSTTSIISGLVCNTTYSFTVKARDGAGNSSAFSNIEIPTTTGVCDPINIALNKPVTVSAFENTTLEFFPGQNLVDGDESDNARWSAELFPQWAEIDLGADYNLTSVKLYPVQNRAYQYIIEAKPTGGVYSTIVNRSTNTTGGDFLVDNVTSTGRYVKITVTGLSGGTSTWVSLAELKVYGTLAGTVTGISEKTVSGITMIPNPTTGILNLSTSAEWTLKSIEGKLLEKGTGKLVDLSKYANGVYIIIIGNKQEKIIKL